MESRVARISSRGVTKVGSVLFENGNQTKFAAPRRQCNVCHLIGSIRRLRLSFGLSKSLRADRQDGAGERGAPSPWISLDQPRLRRSCRPSFLSHHLLPIRRSFKCARRRPHSAFCIFHFSFFIHRRTAVTHSPIHPFTHSPIHPFTHSPPRADAPQTSHPRPARSRA